MAFDRVLRPGPLDHLNWRIIENNKRRLGAAPCTSAGTIVRCRMGGPAIFAGPNEVDYLPPPFDVASSHGVPAAAFAGFPLTIV